MLRELKAVLILTVLCGAASVSASGGQITLQFSGNLYISHLPGISSGQSFSGTLTYSTADPLFNSVPGVAYDYSMISPGDEFSFVVGGYSFSLPAGTGVAGMRPNNYATGARQDIFQVGPANTSPYVVPITNYPVPPGMYMHGFSLFVVMAPGSLNTITLPDPFNTNAVVFQTTLPPSNFALLFSNSPDPFGGTTFLDAAGALNQISTTPEPALGLLTSFVVAALVVAAKRRRSGN